MIVSCTTSCGLRCSNAGDRILLCKTIYKLRIYDCEPVKGEPLVTHSDGQIKTKDKAQIRKARSCSSGPFALVVGWKYIISLFTFSLAQSNGIVKYLIKIFFSAAGGPIS